MRFRAVLFAVAAWSLCVALAAAAVCVLGAPLGRHCPYLDLAGQFAGQAGGGAALIAVLYGLMRLRVMALLALGVAGLALAVTWPREAIAACAPGGAAHRIVFMNVWNGNRDIGATLETLAGMNADVIALVEMRPQFKPALRGLARSYPHMTECGRDCTAVILSRLPLRETTKTLLSPAGPRSQVSADIAFADGRLAVTAVHLTRPWPFAAPIHQQREVAALARSQAPLTGPRVVLGDFNAVPWGAVLTPMRRIAHLTPLPADGTWHAAMPFFFRIPIDQALTGAGLACAHKTVGPKLGSDHRPIRVDFGFVPALDGAR